MLAGAGVGCLCTGSLVVLYCLFERCLCIVLCVGVSLHLRVSQSCSLWVFFFLW